MPGVLVGPRVIRAPEERGVTYLRTTHLHPTVQAHVEQDPDLTLGVPDHDERVVQNPADYVIPRLGDLGFMRQIHPGFAEDSLFLQLEDLIVAVHVGRDQTLLYIGNDFRDVDAHVRIHSPSLLRAGMFTSTRVCLQIIS